MKPRRYWLLTTLGCALFGCVLIRTAWMCDDAYITLRSIDNLVNGNGLRWNVSERVLTFTHPAWALLLSVCYRLTREPFFTTLTVQIVLSISTIALLCGVCLEGAGPPLVAIAAFLSSKALVDFSTSGLENPLTHLLLVLAFVTWRQDSCRGWWRTIPLFGLTALVILCRFDLALLLAPVLTASLIKGGRRTWVAAALGLLPLAAWEMFSLAYYGVLVPNTALAKLATGVPEWALFQQGLHYWFATGLFDPVTPLLLILGTAVLLLLGGRAGRLVAAGTVIYLLYVLRVGGDFMAGRFFTAPLVWTIAGVTGLPLSRLDGRKLAWVAAAIMVAGLAVPGAPPWMSGAMFGADTASGAPLSYPFGVSDERRFYYPTMGLLRRLGRGGPVQELSWATVGRDARRRTADWQVIAASNVGLFGYWAGPRVHIVDRNGLTDPLLARLPAVSPWRIGHFTRTVPDGYLETWRRRENLIADPAIHALYDQVAQVTQAPIWSGRRWRAILTLRFGLTRGW
jgi:arabinofuranosyltransferase